MREAFENGCEAFTSWNLCLTDTGEPLVGPHLCAGFLEVDLETGDTLKLNPMDVQERYRQLMAQRKDDILKHGYQYQIDYVEADINKDYNQILTSYLIKRTKLY